MMIYIILRKTSGCYVMHDIWCTTDTDPTILIFEVDYYIIAKCKHRKITMLQNVWETSVCKFWRGNSPAFAFLLRA
jgi:hypothetical protein